MINKHKTNKIIEFYAVKIEEKKSSNYILNENVDSLINKFYRLQARKPVKNDWSVTVKENKLWTKLCQAQGRNYVLISLVIENLDPKLLYKLKDKHVKI